MIDPLEARINVAEATWQPDGEGVYGNGTTFGGKALTGCRGPIDPTTGTYGGIDRAAWPLLAVQTTTAGRR
jgi:hypothetical protein